jgi:uncharacterized cofD-like protein
MSERNYAFADANVTVIGGGTGSFTLLSELKNYTPNISTIVNMSDDGGSSGKLRDELGVLPPGDIRQCLVALSDSPELREVFAYRFGEGSSGFEGHSLGNIILSGLELKHGCFEKAVKAASELLRITGRVIPATADKHTLLMRDGAQLIKGEHNISEHQIQSHDARLFTCPQAHITDDAYEAIAASDMLMIAPGNTYGSILPVFTVTGIKEAIKSTKGRVIMATNLVTKPGQTDGWHVADYVDELEKYTGRGVIDTVIYNDTPPDPALLQKYAHDGEFMVNASAERLKGLTARAVGASLVAERVTLQDRAAGILPTYIRHDAKVLWDTAFSLV